MTTTDKCGWVVSGLHQYMPVLPCSNQYFTFQTTTKVHGNTVYLNAVSNLTSHTPTKRSCNTWII